MDPVLAKVVSGTDADTIDDMLYRVHTFSAADVALLWPAIQEVRAYLYPSGSIRVYDRRLVLDDTDTTDIDGDGDGDGGSGDTNSYRAFLNPLATMSTIQDTRGALIQANGFTLSPNNTWLLSVAPDTIVLFQNLMYSPQYLDYAEVDPEAAKTHFIRYCNLIDYADKNCLCIQGPKEVYDESRCLETIGVERDVYEATDDLDTYYQFASVCPCVSGKCAHISETALTKSDRLPRFLRDKQLDTCGGSVVICNVRLSVSEDSKMNVDDIKQSCSAYHKESTTASTTPSTTPTTTPSTTPTPKTTPTTTPTTIPEPVGYDDPRIEKIDYSGWDIEPESVEELAGYIAWVESVHGASTTTDEMSDEVYWLEYLEAYASSHAATDPENDMEDPLVDRYLMWKEANDGGTTGGTGGGGGNTTLWILLGVLGALLLFVGLGGVWWRGWFRRQDAAAVSSTVPPTPTAAAAAPGDAGTAAFDRNSATRLELPS